MKCLLVLMCLLLNGCAEFFIQSAFAPQDVYDNEAIKKYRDRQARLTEEHKKRARESQKCEWFNSSVFFWRDTQISCEHIRQSMLTEEQKKRARKMQIFYTKILFS